MTEDIETRKPANPIRRVEPISVAGLSRGRRRRASRSSNTSIPQPVRRPELPAIRRRARAEANSPDYREFRLVKIQAADVLLFGELRRRDGPVRPGRATHGDRMRQPSGHRRSPRPDRRGRHGRGTGRSLHRAEHRQTGHHEDAIAPGGGYGRRPRGGHDRTGLRTCRHRDLARHAWKRPIQAARDGGYRCPCRADRPPRRHARSSDPGGAGESRSGADHAHQIKAAELLLTDEEFCNSITADDLAVAIDEQQPMSVDDEAKAFAKTHRLPVWRALASVWFRKCKKSRKPAKVAA